MMKDKICLALDGLKTLTAVHNVVTELQPYVGLFKIGKELFTRFGPQIVNLVQQLGGNVFLDLKYHDIPNTVMEAAGAATELGVKMFTIHASGGENMIRAAKIGVQKALKPNQTPPKVIAVTVLTSIDDRILYNDLKVPLTVVEQTKNLADLAAYSGADGIVCSAADLEKLSLVSDYGDKLMFVTPGIRMPDGDADDQKRIATPKNAVSWGSSILVIGRAIMNAPNRAKVAQQIIDSLSS